MIKVDGVNSNFEITSFKGRSFGFTSFSPSRNNKGDI